MLLLFCLEIELCQIYGFRGKEECDIQTWRKCERNWLCVDKKRTPASFAKYECNPMYGCNKH